MCWQSGAEDQERYHVRIVTNRCHPSWLSAVPAYCPRTAHDTFGSIELPADCLWGSQTHR